MGDLPSSSCITALICWQFAWSHWFRQALLQRQPLLGFWELSALRPCHFSWKVLSSSQAGPWTLVFVQKRLAEPLCSSYLFNFWLRSSSLLPGREVGAKPVPGLSAENWVRAFRSFPSRRSPSLQIFRGALLCKERQWEQHWLEHRCRSWGPEAPLLEAPSFPRVWGEILEREGKLGFV